jgi:hypothetical protein
MPLVIQTARMAGMLLMLAMIGGALHAQPVAGVQSPWNVLGSGGSIGSSAGNIQLSSTVGQPAIGGMGNAAVKLHLGFWLPLQSTSSVREEPIAEGSTAVELRQNFPNPFSSTTTIGFVVPQRSHVRIRVFNMLGDLVKVLSDQVVEPGYREVMWDGLTDLNERASSGDYVCQLEASSSDGSAVTGGGSVIRKRQVMHLVR